LKKTGASRFFIFIDNKLQAVSVKQIILLAVIFVTNLLPA